MTFILSDSAENYVGSYIKFLWFPGWEEPDRVEGWLHKVSRTKPEDQDQLVYLHVDEAEVLPPGEAEGLGAYGVGFGFPIEVVL